MSIKKINFSDYEDIRNYMIMLCGVLGDKRFKDKSQLFRIVANTNLLRHITYIIIKYDLDANDIENIIFDKTLSNTNEKLYIKDDIQKIIDYNKQIDFNKLKRGDYKLTTILGDDYAEKKSVDNR